jgi:polar amino acid transport system substrate-binding protein
MKPVSRVIKPMLLALSGLGLTLPAAAQVTLHFNERPPYAFVKDGQLSGLIGTPADAAFRAAGIQYTLALTPTARQLQIIKKNSGLDCSASGWFKNEEREGLGKFTRPVYRDKARIALSSARNTKLKDGETIESVLGNKAIKLLVKEGYSYGKVFDQLIEKLQPTTIPVVAENIQMLKMIRAERADLMLVSQEEADGLIVAAGINAADIRKISFANAPIGEQRYIFCSRQVPDELINKLNSALR